MKIKCMLLLGGLVLFSAHLVSATVSSCTGSFGTGTGVCNIFEEPDNADVQDFNLGSPSVGTGIVDILDPNGAVSDELNFYLNADGNVHLLFTSDSGFLGGPIGGTEDAHGNWCYLCGFGNNVYMGVSPGVPEPSSLLLLGSGLLGLAGVVRRRLF